MATGNTGAQRRPFRNGRPGVSPIVAEILMVMITLVIVSSLVYYLYTVQPHTSNIDVPLGTTLEKTSQGNWTLTIVRGRTSTVGTSIMVFNPNTGAPSFSTFIKDPSWYFFYNDNDSDSFVDAGDIILLNQTAGVVEPGFKVELVKSGSTLSGPLPIPI